MNAVMHRSEILVLCSREHF